MILRKINAWLSLLTTLLFLDHAIFHAVWMLSKGTIEKSADSMPRILFAVMMIHAIVSIVLAFLGNKGADKIKCKGYSNLNKTTYIQRFSGIVLIPLTVLHILGTIGIVNPPQIVHGILPPLFFTICLMHVAISTNKAFITLGFGNARFIKIADIVMKLICIVTLIADVIGFYLYLV